MSTSQLATYSSNACEKGYQVDIVLKDGAPWFRACEVTKILGYGNGRQAVLAHVKPRYMLTKEALEYMEPAQERCLSNRRQLQDTSVYISEPGLYALILRSRKPEAEAFQDWVTGTVLPEIREKGGYIHKKPQNKLQICLLNEFDLHAKVIDFVRRFHPDANIVAGLGELQTTDKLRIESWQKGYTKGQCDILLLNKHKKWTGLAIELKSPVGWGVVSAEQQKFLERLQGAGFLTLVSNDYDEVTVQIGEYFRDIRLLCSECGRWVPKTHRHTKKQVESGECTL